MKILLLDIETAPNIAHVWGLWNQNVSINQLIASGYVLCWSAKWLGDTNIYHSSIIEDTHRKMIDKIYLLIDEADAVIHYNGENFDIPTLNKEFLMHHYTPPSSSKQIDLLRVARKQFKFPSNKLDYICKELGLGSKIPHKGHELWIQCMNRDPEAWKVMKEYNINDIIILEKLYYKLRPWIKGHANFSLYNTDAFCCPNCGSKHYHKRGFHYTDACKYQRFRCVDCGTWFRGTKSEAPKPGLKYISI